MQNIRPCPYCGGEVEVVRLANSKSGKKQYRINCLRCKATVAKGIGFPNETPKEAEERIKQYEEEQERLWAPWSSRHFEQKMSAKIRDRQAKYSSRSDPENEREYM